MARRKTTRSARIAALNDQLRCDTANRALGQVLVTAAVAAEGDAFKAKIKAALAAMKAKDFKAGNDPYRERDFNAFEVDGKRLFFKVDYFAKGDLRQPSEDPADAAKTERVMTIFFADEY